MICGNTGKLKNQWIGGPSCSRNTMQYKPKAEICAEPSAESISGPHDVGRPKAATMG